MRSSRPSARNHFQSSGSASRRRTLPGTRSVTTRRYLPLELEDHPVAGHLELDLGKPGVDVAADVREDDAAALDLAAVRHQGLVRDVGRVVVLEVGCLADE